MAKAIWNDVVIAESDATVMVEGNHYFPPESVNQAVLRPSTRRTTCRWKGVASYYDIVVNGQTSTDAAWTYAEPSEAAASIKDHVAFWGDVTVTD